MRGCWSITRDGGSATLEIEVFDPLSHDDADAVMAEGKRLLGFAAGDADGHDIRLRDAA